MKILLTREKKIHHVTNQPIVFHAPVIQWKTILFHLISSSIERCSVFSIRCTVQKIKFPSFLWLFPKSFFPFFAFFSTIILWHWLDFLLSSYGRFSLFRTHILCWRFFFSLSITPLTPESWKHYIGHKCLCAVRITIAKVPKCNKIPQCHKFVCQSVFVYYIVRI